MTIFASFQQSIVNRKWYGFQMIIIAQNITKQGFFNNRGSFRSTIVESILQITPFYAKQSQFPKNRNRRNPFYKINLREFSPLFPTKKQSQNKPNVKTIIAESGAEISSATRKMDFQTNEGSRLSQAIFLNFS